jgi:CheY-like chemotaxis protein
MPPKAEVLVVEDNKNWQENYARWLPSGEHRVAATIADISDAPTAIHDLKKREVKIDVAIVDGNLGESSHGEDGAEVVEMLRDKYPDTKIIGITFDQAGVLGADVNIHKAEVDPTGLVDLITSL